jgi:hypothetical protein
MTSRLVESAQLANPKEVKLHTKLLKKGDRSLDNYREHYPERRIPMKFSMFVCNAFVLAVLLSIPLAEAAIEGRQCQPESSVSEPQPIAYGEVITCAITPIGDTDTYQFTASAGEIIQMHLVRRSGGALSLSLFAPNGNKIGSPPWSTAPRWIFATLPNTGVYTLVVQEPGNNSPLEYTLVLERIIPPSPPTPTICFGCLATEDEMNPTGDLDLFSFWARAGDQIQAKALRRGTLGELSLSLFAPSGDKIGSPPWSTAPRLINIVLPQTGLYTLMVQEAGTDSLLQYALSLECLSGSCIASPSLCNGKKATIVGSELDDILIGTKGNDVIHGRGGNDLINGLVGNDVICGGNGNDVLVGGQNNDQLFGDSGHDVLMGGPGNDMLRGGSGNDTLDGGSGNDTLTGEAGNDVCEGGVHVTGDTADVSCELRLGIENP